MTSSKIPGAVTLSTTTTCFLCLNNDISNQSFNSDGEGDSLHPSPSVSLRSICRYLKINFNDIFTNCCATKRKTPTSNVSVLLCKQCTSVVSKLSNLCMELELLQMKTNDCLKTFNGLLETSEQDVQRVQNFDGLQRTGLVDEFSLNAAKLLRSKMKINCTARISNDLPKVAITRQLEPPVIKSPAVSKRVKVTKTVITKSGNIQKKLAKKFKSIRKPIKKPKKPTTNLQLPTRFRNLAICTLCQPARQMERKELKRHKVQKHLETFFIPLKLPHTSMLELKAICKHVINGEIALTKTITNSKGNSVCQCTHCNAIYSNPSSLHYHIFTVHEQILCRKVVQLQQRSKADLVNFIKSPQKSRFPPGHPWSGHQCDVCGAVLSRKANLKRHMERIHGSMEGRPESSSGIMEHQEEMEMDAESSGIVEGKVEVITDYFGGDEEEQEWQVSQDMGEDDNYDPLQFADQENCVEEKPILFDNSSTHFEEEMKVAILHNNDSV